jgi:hypothetical protein
MHSIIKRKSTNNDLKTEYADRLKKHSINCKKTKKSYHDNKIATSKNISKTSWNIISTQAESERSPTNLKLIINDIEITDPLLLADKYNSFFISAGNIAPPLPTVPPHTDILQDPKVNTHPPFILHPTNSKELTFIAQSLRYKHSSGIDEIPGSLLTKNIIYLSEPLARIINTSFISGTFPHFLKQAIVIPIHKKGDKSQINNYRPISLLSSISKLIEKIMLSRLTDYLTTHSIITDCQHGFQKLKSTTTATFNLLNSLYTALDKGNHAIGLFYDLSKAFDTINHDLLLKKLNDTGIQGIPNKWFNSFLSDRTQMVKIKSFTDNSTTYSSPLSIKQGVPQGSVLSPLLFLLYVNDLPNFITTGQLFQFADDTNHLITAPKHTNINSLSQIANKQTSIISSYCLNNKLALQPSKSLYINFHTKFNTPSSQPLIRVNNKIIHNTPHTKFLGIHLTPNLDFSLHIKITLNKIKSSCFLLRRLKPIVNHHTLKLVYHSYIHSHLSYGILFWGSCPQAKRIFLIQKQAVRVISGISRRKSCKSHFIHQNILTLTCTLIKIASTLVRSHPHLFTHNEEIHNHATRNKNSIHTISHTHSLFKNSPIHLCTKIYNSLPIVITKIQNLSSFTSSIKSFLLQNPFYTLDEFYNFHSNNNNT